MRTVLMFISLLLSHSVVFAQAFTKYDLTPGSRGSAPTNFVVAGGKMFFTTLDSNTTTLWVTDGTENSFQKLIQKSIDPYYAYNNLIAWNGKIFFWSLDSMKGSVNQLWTSDGTVAGTYMIKEFFRDRFGRFTVYNDRLLFTALDTSVIALWSSDGTEAGTHIIYSDFRTGWTPSSHIYLFGDKAYFTVLTIQSAHTLWCTDGTTEGTKPADLPGIDPSTINYTLAVTDSKLFFALANNQSGVDPWVSDNTLTGTHVIKNMGTSSHLSFTDVTLDNKGLFSTTDTSGNGLWYCTDGTDTGTHSFWNSSIDFNQPCYATFRHQLFFTNYDTDRVFVTDGTSRGTRELTDSSSNFVSKGYFAAGAKEVYIIQPATPTSGAAVYRTDGTEKGTYLIKQRIPAKQFWPSGNSYINFNGAVWVAACLDGDGPELWKIQDTTHHLAQPVIIYPNPNHGSFTISTADSNFTGRIHICDVAGREVYYNNHVSGSIINVTIPGAAAGVYFLTMQDISDPKTSRTISSYKIVVW